MFRFDLPDVSNPTKRSILSIVAKIFDLLGLLSPIVVRCKMLLQELWVQNIGWDDSVNSSITKMWLQIKDDDVMFRLRTAFLAKSTDLQMPHNEHLVAVFIIVFSKMVHTKTHC